MRSGALQLQLWVSCSGAVDRLPLADLRQRCEYEIKRCEFFPISLARPHVVLRERVRTQPRVLNDGSRIGQDLEQRV